MQRILKLLSPHDALVANLKILGTLKEVFVMESVFGVVTSDRLDSSNCLPKVFAWESPEVFKT